MAIAQVTCKVCGSTVNKRQTLQVGENRVCRSHNEAVEQKQRLAQEAAVEATKHRELQEKVDGYVRNIRLLARAQKIRNLQDAVKQMEDGIPKEYRVLVRNKVLKLGHLSSEEQLTEDMTAEEVNARLAMWKGGSPASS